MPNDNLVVIAAMARKGGSGKTTLSRALISAAVAAGSRVLLVDTDSTRVLGAWHARAEAGVLAHRFSTALPLKALLMSKARSSRPMWRTRRTSSSSTRPASVLNGQTASRFSPTTSER